MGIEEKPLNPLDSSDDDFAPSYQVFILTYASTHMEVRFSVPMIADL